MFDDVACSKLARDIVKRIEDEMEYPGQVRVTVVREARVVEIAKQDTQILVKTELKVLFLGDMVGRIGRKTVQKFLEKNKANYDFIIANVENASHGFGLTLKNHDELASYGIDCMTS